MIWVGLGHLVDRWVALGRVRKMDPIDNSIWRYTNTFAYLLTYLLTQCRVLLSSSNWSVLSANSLMTTHVAVTAFEWDPKPSNIGQLDTRPPGINDGDSSKTGKWQIFTII